MASDESEDPGASTPVVETTTPSASAVTLNGRRKSSGRKPKKKPLVRFRLPSPCISLTDMQSEETISPEDEEDDPMAVNGFATPAIASPLPVRSGTSCFFEVSTCPTIQVYTRHASENPPSTIHRVCVGHLPIILPTSLTKNSMLILQSSKALFGGTKLRAAQEDDSQTQYQKDSKEEGK